YNLPSGRLTVTSSIIDSNPGGGLYNLGGTVTLTSSTLSSNSAFGGIVNAYYGTMTVTNCTISANSASGPHAPGGGISNDGTLTVINCTLSANSAEQGGGIFNYSGVNAGRAEHDRGGQPQQPRQRPGHLRQRAEQQQLQPRRDRRQHPLRHH